MNQPTRSRLLRAAPALLGGAGVVYPVLLAIYSRPIADDWAALSSSGHTGLASAIGRSGRYSASALGWIAVHLLGAASTQLTPLIVLITLWASGTWALSRVDRAARLTNPAWELGLLALLVMVGCFSVAPSLIDNVAWFSGVGGYTAPLAATACLTAWCWQLATTEMERARIGIAVTLAGGFVTAGFQELVGLILLPTAVLALLTARSLEARRSLIWAIAAAGLGAAAGLAVNLLNPVTIARASTQHARVDLAAALHTTWHDLTFLYGPIHSGRLLLTLSAGVLAWQLFGSTITSRRRRLMIIWTTFLLVVPWLIVSAACAWANATESGGRAPFRAAFLFTSPADLGIVLAVLIALSLAPRLLRQPRATIVAVVLAAGGLVALGHTAEPLIRAERMRMHALALRAAAVNEQVASGRRDIEMLPAPLLTADTQALDLSFEPLNAQRPWVVALLRSFYRIPATERVAILTRQPADYCLESISASWVGVRSCQQLAADG